jgi:ferredoxin-type protein NapH
MRQKLRKALILISFLLFPVTIFYFSPAIPFFSGAAGVLAGSTIMFGLLFISSFIFGRAFCGYVCPGAGLQEMFFPVRNKKVVKGYWVKYAIWAPWLAGIIILVTVKGGYKSIDPFFATVNGISVSDISSYITFYFFIALIAALALVFGKRSFCHHACWMAPFMVIGTKIKDKLRVPSLRLKADKEKCTQCMLCAKNCPMSLPVNEMVKAGNMKNAECILCGECVDGCQKRSITYS